MTLEKLIALLQTVCPETYELAAPQGVKRRIVAHTYTNGRSLYGDDQNLFDIEKVQLDILTQKNSDTLLLDVCECCAHGASPTRLRPSTNTTMTGTRALHRAAGADLMASFKFNGMDELTLSLSQLAQTPEDVQYSMLEAGAAVLVKAWKKGARADEAHRPAY